MPAVSSTPRVPPSSPGSSHELQAPQANPAEEHLAHKPRSHPLQHPQSDPAPLHNQSIPTSPPWPRGGGHKTARRCLRQTWLLGLSKNTHSSGIEGAVGVTLGGCLHPRENSGVTAAGWGNRLPDSLSWHGGDNEPGLSHPRAEVPRGRQQQQQLSAPGAFLALHRFYPHGFCASN